MVDVITAALTSVLTLGILKIPRDFRSVLTPRASSNIIHLTYYVKLKEYNW